MELNKNPFSGYGNIIYGDRFIGRNSDIEIINQRVFKTIEPANIAIIGCPRIGKSSLVKHTIEINKKLMSEKNIISIWLNIGTFASSNEFFFSSLKLVKIH